MNKKGFTLIELLAVIVLLAIIALIAIPLITNAIKEAKKGAAKNSVLGYIDAVEKQAAINLLNSDATDDIKADTYTIEQLTDKKVVINGDLPAGTVEVNNEGKVIDYDLTINGFRFRPTKGDPYHPSAEEINSSGNQTSPNTLSYRVSYNANGGSGEMASTENTIVANVFTPPSGATFKEWNTEPDGSGETYTTSSAVSSDLTLYAIWKSSKPTKVAAQQGETHKGIVYMDPTDITKYCDAELAANNVNEFGTPTGIKKGCMKFYIYDDSGDNYKMILDHNTSLSLYNTTSAYVAYENAPIKLQVDFDTKGWVGNPGLITAQEIATITGNTTFNGSSSTWFYFDSNNKTKIATSPGASKYAWLYDYMTICFNYGCNIQESVLTNYIGYWTKSLVTDKSTDVWAVSVGYLYNVKSDQTNQAGSQYGVRPVITIPKTSING